MGALGDYIHLTWDGYLGKGENKKGTYYWEQFDIYNKINSEKEQILQDYSSRIQDEQIQQYQKELNIFLGIEQSEGIKSNTSNDNIIEYLQNKVYERLTNFCIDKNKDIKNIIFDFQKKAIKRTELTDNEKKLINELEKIREIYKEMDNNSNKKDIKNFIDTMNKLNEELSTLNQILETITGTLEQQENNSYIIEGALQSALIELISNFSSQITGILTDIQNNQKNISYKKIEALFSNIKYGKKTASLYAAISDFIEMITYVGTINNLKGAAVEILLGEIEVLRRAKKIAENTAVNSILDVLNLQNFDQEKEFQKTQAGDISSKTFIDRGIYSEPIKKQMEIISKKEGNIIITNPGGAQEKVDVYITLEDKNKNPISAGASVKNYEFKKLKSGINTTTLDLITNSNLSNFLQGGIGGARLDVFGNHLLNLNLKHYKRQRDKLIYSQDPTSSSDKTNIQNQRNMYLSLLNEIILIKSLTGEGLLRSDKNKNIKTMNGAPLLIVNDSSNGIIKVYKTQDIIKNCLDSRNGSIKSYIYFSSDLSKIENRMIKGDNGEDIRIPTIMFKLEKIKINTKIKLSYKDSN